METGEEKKNNMRKNENNIIGERKYLRTTGEHTKGRKRKESKERKRDEYVGRRKMR